MNLRKYIVRHEKGIQRLLEFLPGFVSWNLILFPYWGILLAPLVVAYYVLLFDIYWFYQSALIALTSLVSHFRIEASKKFDWKGEIKSFPDFQKVHHVIIIPTYKEPLHILERTITSIANQDLDTKQITVVVAQEKKEDEAERELKARSLRNKFRNKFSNFLVTLHELAPGEVVGKASNERWAAVWVKKNFIDKKKIDLKYTTVTSCDADHTFHPKHFSLLTYKFLDDPDRYHKFWQPAILFYSNIWKLPAINRVSNTLSSIWNLSQLSRRDRLINYQNYSLSFKLLDKVGYWDPDIIPEDYHIFFKSFYKTRGRVEVDAIYLPLYADAPLSTSLIKTIKSQYDQYQRWAWGVSDDPYVIKNYFLTPGISFFNKTTRILGLIKEHFLWPVNWFIITIGITFPSFLNPAFSRSVIGYNLPRISSIILTLALSFLVIMLILEAKHKPPRPETFPRWRAILSPLEFILMPVAGFIFSALPGLDAHTRLMLGKYLEYKVTEKV